MRVILNVGIDTASTISAAAQLLNATVSYVVGKAAAPLPRVYFGTGQVVGSESLYSMAQCDPDLSPAECHSCLKKLKLELLAVVVNVNGWPVGWRCGLRCETQRKFFAGEPNVKLVMNGNAVVPLSAPSTEAAPPSTEGTPAPSTMGQCMTVYSLVIKS